MVKSQDIDEQDMEKLSDLVKDFRHETGTPLAVLCAHYHDHKDGSTADEEIVDLGEFIENAVEADFNAELLAKVPENNVDNMISYIESDPDYDLLEEKFGLDNTNTDLEKQVNRLAKATQDIYSYQRLLEDNPVEDSLNFGELMEPLEECFESLERTKDNVNLYSSYRVSPDVEVDADPSLRLVTWTLAKNWEEHAYSGDQDIIFGFQVDESDCFYEVDVWDTGDGLYDDFPTKGKSSESRYRKADGLFKSDKTEGSGHGLPMAREVAEYSASEIFYSEETFEGSGFGVRLRIPKYSEPQ